MPTYDWAVNRTKLNIATTRANNKVATERSINPTKEIPDATEADIKREYIALAGLLAVEDTAVELETRAKFVKMADPAAKNMRERVEGNKKRAKKAE